MRRRDYIRLMSRVTQGQQYAAMARGLRPGEDRRLAAPQSLAAMVPSFNWEGSARGGSTSQSNKRARKVPLGDFA